MPEVLLSLPNGSFSPVFSTSQIFYMLLDPTVFSKVSPSLNSCKARGRIKWDQPTTERDKSLTKALDETVISTQ